MADLNYTVSVETARAQRNLQRLRDNTDRASKTFDRLKTAIAGIAVGALYRSTLQLSDAIANMSRATNISVGSILAFSQAMTTSGGTADRARDAISDLTKNLGEAAAGSKELQKAFGDANVSLEDMRNLSEEDIFRKTLEGLTQIPNRAQRSATAMRLLGESVKGVDLDNLNRQFGLSIAQVGPYAASLQSAAEANTKLQENLNNLTLALLNVIKPLNDLVSAITISPQAFESMIRVAAALAGGLLILTGGITKLNLAFNLIARGIRNTRGSFRGLNGVLTAAGKDIRGVSRSWVRYGKTVAGVEGFNTKLKTSILATGFGFTRAGVRLLGFAGVVYSVVEAINALTRAVTGQGLKDWLDDAALGLERLVKSNFPALYDAIQGVNDALNLSDSPLEQLAAAESLEEAKNKALALRDEVLAGLQSQIGTQNKVVDGLQTELNALNTLINGYKSKGQSTIEGLRFQQQQNRLTSEQAEYVRTIKDFYDQHASQLSDLRSRWAELNKNPEENKRQLELISEAIETLNNQYAEQLPIVEQIAREIRDQAIAMQEAAEAAEKLKQAQEIARDFATSMAESTRDAQREFDMLTMGSLEKEIFQIENRIRDQLTSKVKELQKAMAETSDPATRAQIQQQINSIEQAAESAIKTQTELAEKGYAQSREWATGWERAFRDYAEAATDASKTAERVFEKATKGMEDALVGFVKTGKFEWRGFVNSIIEELLRSQIRQLIAQVFGGLGSIGGGGSSGGGSGGLLGGRIIPGFLAEGGPASANRPYIVGEKGPELFVPNTSGTVIPNNQLQNGSGDFATGGVTNVTYNINAVDAASFKQLVASDPEFIFAVTEQGRRSLPLGRR